MALCWLACFAAVMIFQAGMRQGAATPDGGRNEPPLNMSTAECEVAAWDQSCRIWLSGTPALASALMGRGHGARTYICGGNASKVPRAQCYSRGERFRWLKRAWHLLKGTTILLLGDSISMEHYFALLCELREFSLLGGSEVPPLVPPRLQIVNESGVSMHCARFEKALPSVCYAPEDALHCGLFNTIGLCPMFNKQCRLKPEVPCFKPAPPGSRGYILERLSRIFMAAAGDSRELLIVMNAGLHYSHNLTLLHDITAMQLNLFASLPQKLRPRIFWRETAAQHWNTSAGIYMGKISSRQCVNLPLSMVRDPGTSKANIFNRATEPVVSASRDVTILRTWAQSAAFWRGHKNGDCTHYCLESGLFDSWTDMLCQALLSKI
mmetsp:Transcript_8561/g.26745  ORF Transcript_8561/g.26745 Transcript_8561/m.26745 type:complete len:380 (-) Transcript_8561:2-1141(-)